MKGFELNIKSINKTVHKHISNIFKIMLIPLLVSFTNDNNHQDLFNIERSRNSDQIIYTIKLNADKTIDQQNPFKIFWLKKSQSNKTEALTSIQNKFGYGVIIKELSPFYINFSIAALPNQTFYVKADEAHYYNAFTTINNNEVKVNSIYIAFKKGTFWVPDIDSVQLKYTNNISTEEFVKTIYSE